MQVSAADFEFDRPGAGISTGITPVGKLAREQALPSARLSGKEIMFRAKKLKPTRLNADMLLRTGLAQDLELQSGLARSCMEQKQNRRSIG